MFDSLSDPTPRRGFLARAAAAAAGVGLSGSFVACASAAPPPPAEKSSASNDPALDAWFTKINGKHKEVFDATSPNSGMSGIWPRIYLNTMVATYANETGTAVVILRHNAIPLAMADAMWAKYNLGEVFSVKDAKGKPAVSNIYAKIEGLPIPGLGIAELIAGGVLVGACDMALTVNSMEVAGKMKLKAEDVKKDWVANLLPGIQVVPSGVMAVGRTQELGCAYCYAG